LKSKLAHLAGKQEHFQKKRKEFQDIEEHLRAENLQLKQKFSHIDPARTALRKNTTAEEIRIKKAMSQLQILRDELFRKDTDLVKKAREMIKLEKEIESVKSVNQKMHGKMKAVEAEIIAKVSQDLEEKDRQIEILKEMLRCAHSDIKLKDMQINNMRGDRMTSPKRK
jgi:chromosome segregation ATPase